MADMLKKTLLSLVMDKKARETLELARKYKEMEAQQKGTGNDAVAEQPAVEPSPERKEAIRDAMAVRREKSKILDNLSERDRLKLEAMALKAFMEKSGGTQN